MSPLDPFLADAGQATQDARALANATHPHVGGGGGVSPWWVAIYERDAPQKRLDAILGDTPPTPAPSGGGSAGGDWDIVTLPKRSAVAVWRGRQNLLLMSVPIVLGEAGGHPQHPAATVLGPMWRPSDPTAEPPVVKIRAKGTSVPYQNLDYVVANIAWGDIVGNQAGDRVLQKLTVSLLEYRADEVLQVTNAQAQKHKARTYTVKAGDTLSSIARKLGVKGGWKAIGNLQHPPIHDPRKIHVGQRLLIP